MSKETNRYAKRFYDLVITEGYEVVGNSEYKTAKLPVKIIHLSCGNEWDAIPDSFVNRGTRCGSCSIQIRADKNRKSYAEIEQVFQSKGLSLITKEYKTTTTKMEYICELGHSGKIAPSSIIEQGTGCRECSKARLSEMYRLPYKQVEEAFAKEGYTLLTEKYINSGQKLDYVCNIGHEESMHYSNFQSGKRCPSCSHRGETHHNWKGGITPLNIFLRRYLSEWRSLSLLITSNRCDITGVDGEIHVHHRHSFHKIVSIMLEDLNLEVRESMSMYSEEEKYLLSTEIKKRHKDLLGAPLLEEVHFLYHRLFGYDNTVEQYEFFKENYEGFLDGTVKAPDYKNIKYK